MLKAFLKKQKKLFIIVSIIIAFFVMYFLCILKKPFLLGNDQWFQYNVFYKEWIRLIKEFVKNGSLPMYSWNMYLGTDFYSAMGYYCTGDIFLPIICLLYKNIELALLIEIIICIYISALFMNSLLIKNNVEDENGRILISIIYAFGGMASLYYGNYMFHRFYAFLPLLFIGLHSYFDKKKLCVFVLATCILFLQNYYFMFPTLLFLFIYSLAYEFKNKKKFKEIFKDFIILLVALIIGFLISAIVTLPSMMYLLNNSRVGTTNDSGVFWPINTYIGLLMSLISFNPVETGFDIFQNSGQAHVYQFTLFITIIPLISSLKHLFKKENRIDLVTLLILLSMLCIKPLSSIMHGFSNPSFRWIFVVELYLLIIAGKGLDDLDVSKDKKFFMFYFGLYSISFILLIVFGYVNQKVINHVIILTLSLLISILIIYSYGKNKSVGIVLSILEIVCFEGYYLSLETAGAKNYAESIDYQEIDYDQSIDEDVVYRYNHSYKNNNPDSILNQNKSLDYRFMSVSSYNSMSDSNIETFNSLANANKDLDWVLYVDDYYANTMLGVKYYIVYDESDLPLGNFEYAYNLDYLKVYKNLDYKGFGFSASKLKYTSEFNSTKDFVDYIMVDDDSIDISKYSNLESVKLNVTDKYDNYFKANIELTEDNIVLIPIPNNSGWTIKVNGEIVIPISVNGGFIGLELNAGYNEIEMNFISPYFKVGCLMTIFGIVGFCVFIFIDKKKKVYEC